MFGYACNETEELMPAPVMFAHRILRKMAEIRKAGEQAKWLRPDCKSQVALRYEDGRMVGIENAVVSTQQPRTPTMTPFVILSFPISSAFPAFRAHR